MDTAEVNCEHFHKILFGGDQLSVARARGAQMERKNEDRPTRQLRGLVPVVEDWHGKQCF